MKTAYLRYAIQRCCCCIIAVCVFNAQATSANCISQRCHFDRHYFENCDKKLNCYICIRCRDVKALAKTPRKTGEKVQRRKKSKKLVKKACKVDGDVVLYLSAKRWDKRMTSESQLEVKRKEPIDARKSGRNARDFRDAPSSVRNEKLRKNKAWQKTTSVVK